MTILVPLVMPMTPTAAEICKLPKERLYATYFEGAQDKGLEPDLEAKALWET